MGRLFGNRHKNTKDAELLLLIKCAGCFQTVWTRALARTVAIRFKS